MGMKKFTDGPDAGQRNGYNQINSLNILVGKFYIMGKKL